LVGMVGLEPALEGF